MLDSKQASFLRDHVRHLLMGGDTTSVAILILSRCSGTMDLALHCSLGPSFLPIVAILPSQRLSASLYELFGGGEVDFSHVLFTQITHIEIFGTPLSNDFVVGLGQLPRLTHLSFILPFLWSDKDGFYATLFLGVLASCSRLEALFLVFWGLKEIASYNHFAPDDSRSILMLVDDSMVGGEDFWIRAERFIAQRQSGEIDGVLARFAKETHTNGYLHLLASPYIFGVEFTGMEDDPQ